MWPELSRALIKSVSDSCNALVYHSLRVESKERERDMFRIRQIFEAQNFCVFGGSTFNLKNFVRKIFRIYNYALGVAFTASTKILIL